MRNYAIIPSAGVGRRMGGAVSKQFLQLHGKPILCHTLECFERASTIDGVIVVVPVDQLKLVEESIQKYSKVMAIVAGGDKRQDSVYNGLKRVPASAHVVAVHDGVRPLVTVEQINATVEAAAQYGGAILATPVSDTIKRVEVDEIKETVERSLLWAAQTPQSFRYGILMDAMDTAMNDGYYGTDEASLVERVGGKIRVVCGNRANIKITTPDDLPIAEAILMARC